MTLPVTPEAGDFWDPEFEYEHRADGSILMRQPGQLTGYLPTLADYLDDWADKTPDKTWIARRQMGGDWQRISYAEGRAKARALGSALLDMGLGPNRPLLVLSENSLEHALLGAACFYVGIPYAPVSPAYSLLSSDYAKLKGIAATLSPGAVFGDNGNAFSPAFDAIRTDGMVFITLTPGIVGATQFQDLLDFDTAKADAARLKLTSDTVVKYLFTSGSTGAPKAVINTNRMICAMEAMVRDCYRFLKHAPPVVLDWAPWNHTAAGNKVFYLVLTNGGTYYIDDGRPTPDRFSETMRNLAEVSCTWYFNVPIGWDMLAEALDADAVLAQTFFRHLRMMFYAGAGMAQHTWDKLKQLSVEATGQEVLLATGLGATETSPFALACTEIQSTAGNVGVPSLGLTMKLVPADGKMELRLKGPTITPGYFGDASTTAEAFDDEGFYRMGDALRPANPDDLSEGFFFDGRLAENFKLATGTWVAVGSVRSMLVDAMEGLVRDAVIVGENEIKLGALLLLSENAKEVQREALTKTIESSLARLAERASGSASRVCLANILPRDPSFDKGEVTEKGSLNQRAMRNSFSELIEQMYREAPDFQV